MFAHAIHNLWVSKCGAEAKSLCPEFNQVSHTQLINYLHNVSFNDVDGFPFKFEDQTHDGPPRYSIISYMESEQNPGEILFEVFSTIFELLSKELDFCTEDAGFWFVQPDCDWLTNAAVLFVQLHLS